MAHSPAEPLTEGSLLVAGLLSAVIRFRTCRAAIPRLETRIEQPEPFEKTPTRKIKRYLYVD